MYIYILWSVIKLSTLDVSLYQSMATFLVTLLLYGLVKSCDIALNVG